jgi:hypothetical protein
MKFICFAYFILGVNYLYFKDQNTIPNIMKPSKHENYPKQRVKCSLKGCNNFKLYNHSKTGSPVCSLDCYKRVEVK